MATQTTLPPPNTVGTNLSKSDYFWALLVQLQLPLVTIDTSAGDVAITLPDPGIGASGQTAQNMEITYRKTSSDGHTATISGSPDGDQVLTTNTGAGSVVKFKSDGTDWWVSQWP